MVQPKSKVPIMFAALIVALTLSVQLDYSFYVSATTLVHARVAAP